MNKQKVRDFMNDESGDISIKGIAITVAIILVIGAAVSLINGGLLAIWIGDIWSLFYEKLKTMIGTSTP